MKPSILITVGLFSFLFGGCSKEPPEATEIEIEIEAKKKVGEVPVGVTQPGPVAPSSSKYQAGQVWAFKTSANQAKAKLTILQVEDGGKVGTIVHIAISDVSYGNGQTSISHLPFAESAIAQSVTTLEREASPLPDFAEGYRLWREAFTAGKGGVFTIGVAEALDMVTGAVPRP